LRRALIVEAEPVFYRSRSHLCNHPYHFLLQVQMQKRKKGQEKLAIENSAKLELKMMN
jgi:hypothetical protein